MGIAVSTLSVSEGVVLVGCTTGLAVLRVWWRFKGERLPEEVLGSKGGVVRAGGFGEVQTGLIVRLAMLRVMVEAVVVS